MDRTGKWQFKARFGLDLKDDVQALARRRRLSVGRLVESLLRRELDQVDASGSVPDESAIREMAILFAVELSVKLQEANIPGGPSLSRRLMDSAAQAAIARVELIEDTLRKVAK